MTVPQSPPDPQQSPAGNPLRITPAQAARVAAQSNHRITGLRSWWESVGEWRNWRLPVKVGAVLAVPALAAITLGAIQIHSDVATADNYGRIQQLVSLRNALQPLTTDLQNERWLAAQKLGTATPIGLPDFYTASNKVDVDSQAVTRLGDQLLAGGDAADIRYQGLLAQLDELGNLHQQALDPSADAVTVISNYSSVISSVVDLEQALNTQLGDAALTAPATAMTDVEVAQEQVRQQQAIVAVVISRNQLQEVELETLNSSEILLNDRLNDFEVVAAPAELASYERPAVISAVNSRDAFAQTVLSNGQTLFEVGSPTQSGAPLGVPAASWIRESDGAATQLAGVAGRLATELRTTSANLQSAASDAAGVVAVVLFAILLLALGVGFVVGRHLLWSLNILRGTALEVAEHRLPEVVASIDAGDLTSLEIAPVPVHTHEELGQLARAFDAVHAQAVESAAGQAALRSNLRNIFINLSRRSQSLVERQLRLMERLERNEEDPQQLANLFRLDHLATRMRRNNENLMVLSGDDPSRRSGHPLPLADVLRAAVSEIEQYQRVVVRSTPSVDVLGYASGDLVRLIAELLDNATSFSPPNTQVRIGGQHFPDGSVRIEIRDEGIAMADAELAEANGRLTAADTTDVPVSRQMGLYVVGRLARRHSIDVSLQVVPEGGLLAVVQVPTDLVKPGELPAQPEITTNGHTNGHAVTNGTHLDQTAAALPAFDMEAPSGQDLPVMAAPEPPEPEWGVFTGAAIPDPSVNLAPSGFTWFITKNADDEPRRPASVAPPTPPEQHHGPAPSFTSVGLPRRVPRSHAVPSLVPPSSPRGRQPVARPQQPAEAVRLNPTRAKGFLDDYQAGLRGQPDPATRQREGDAQ